MKIVILDGHTLNPGDNPWDSLRALGEVVLHDQTPDEQIVDRSREADVLLINKIPLDESRLAQLPQLRLIAVSATGYDCVDTASARKRGVAVVHVPEYGTDSVAQHTIALLLQLCNRTAEHDAAIRVGQWQRCGHFSFWNHPLIELAGKRLGLVGYGRIGRRVARIAQALGMEVWVATRTPIGGSEVSIREAGLDELFSQSDVISLHCPATPETIGLVDRSRLAQVRPEAILINTARGQLVVERDLADALNEGRLAAAGLDVMVEEPLPADSPLLTAKNCILTPHLAWASLESRRRLMATTAENIKAYFAGRPIHVVN
jgi:glycerate dehydrogenase